MVKIKYPDPLHSPVTARILILSLLGYNKPKTIKEKIIQFSDNTISDGIQALVREKYLLYIPNDNNKKDNYYPPNRNKIREDLLNKQAKFLDPSFYLGKAQAKECYELMQEGEAKIKETKKPINKRKFSNVKYRNDTFTWLYAWQKRYNQAFNSKIKELIEKENVKTQQEKDKVFNKLVRESTPIQINEIINDYLGAFIEIPESKQFKGKSFFVDCLPLINNFEFVYSMFYTFLNKNKELILAKYEDNEKLTSYFNQLMLNKTNIEKEQAMASLFAIEDKPTKALKNYIEKMETSITLNIINEKYEETVLSLERPINLHSRIANKKMKHNLLIQKKKQVEEEKRINSIFQ